MTRLLCVGDQHFQKGAHLHPDRLGEQERNWREILQLARNEHVDAVLHAGDMMDVREPRPDAILAAERPLIEHRDQRGCPVVAINGNGQHDAEHGTVPSPVQVFHEAGLLELHREPVLVHLPGVTIACLPWMSVKHLRARAGGDWTVDELNQRAAELLVTIAADLRARAQGPCVLLTHFTLSDAVTVNGDPVEHFFREPILQIGDLSGFDTVVAGHVHRAQLLADDPATFYVGSPMPLAFDEGCFDHGVWLLDLVDGVSPQPGHARFVPLESPRFLTLDADDVVTGCPVDGSYVRVKVAAGDAQGVDPREWERALVEDGGARYARVEIEQARAVRARVEQLDDTVDDSEAFQMWLDTQEDVDRDTGLVLIGMDTAYREQVAA